MRALFFLPLISLSCAVAAPTAAAQDLPAAVSDALDHAPELAEAAAGETAAKARLDRARAERNPLLRIEGSVGKGRIDPGGFFGLPSAGTTPLGLQATAEMPMWTGGRIGSAADQAKAASAWPATGRKPPGWKRLSAQ